MIRIYPAVMGINSESMRKLALLKGHIDRVHIDIMNNSFVHNVTQGSELISQYAEKEGLYVWAHLMIQDVAPFLGSYELPKGSLVSFHLESSSQIFETIKIIKEKKYKASIAINPKTAIEEVVPYLNVIDQVLIMSVNPGFSGQSFLPEVLKKIDVLVEYRKRTEWHFYIAIDGGVNKGNIKQLAQQGVDEVAVASGIFNNPNPLEVLHDLEDLVERSLIGI